VNLTHHETLVRELCTVCGSSDARLFLRESTAEVYKCSACGHLFTRAIYRAQEEWKEELKASGGWNVKETDNPRDPFYRWVLDSLGSAAQSKRRLLEVGCATGRFLELAIERGFVTTGIEQSADALIAPGRVPKAKILRGSFPDDFGASGPFDVVASFEVLEHIPNVEAAIARISELLVPGGHFVGSVPNRLFHENKVWPRRNLKIAWLGVPLTLGPDQHLNYFSPSGLGRVFQKHGMSIRKVITPPQTDFGLANEISKYLRRVYGSVTGPLERMFGRPLRTNFYWDAVKL
jgi:SAM-dependent methyltransferase